MEQIKAMFQSLYETIMKVFQSFVGSDNSIFNSLKEFFDKIFGGAAE